MENKFSSLARQLIHEFNEITFKVFIFFSFCEIFQYFVCVFGLLLLEEKEKLQYVLPNG